MEANPLIVVSIDQENEKLLKFSELTLQARKISAFWNQDTQKNLIEPMIKNEIKQVYGMGDDLLANVLSALPPHIKNFSTQKFIKQSNSKLDSEKDRNIFDTEIVLGKQSDDENPQITFDSPILNNQLLLQIENNPNIKKSTFDITFSIYSSNNLELRLIELQTQALKEVKSGSEIIILTDRQVNAKYSAIPDLMALVAIRDILLKNQLDDNVSIIVDSAQINSPQHASCLLAYGATALNPYLAYEEIKSIAIDKNLDYYTLKSNYQQNMLSCHLKYMSKFGITSVNYFSRTAISFFKQQSKKTTNNTKVTANSVNLLDKIFKGIYSPYINQNTKELAKYSITKLKEGIIQQNKEMEDQQDQFNWESSSTSSWADSISPGLSVFTQLYEDTRKKIIKHVTQGNYDCIIDVGCGTGEIVGELKTSIPCFGMDINPNFVDHCKKTYPNICDFEIADATELYEWWMGKQDRLGTSFKNPYLLCCNNTIMIMPNVIRERVISQMLKVAGKGGKMLITYWNGHFFPCAVKDFYLKNPALCGKFELCLPYVDFKKRTINTQSGYASEWCLTTEIIAVLQKYNLNIREVSPQPVYAVNQDDQEPDFDYCQEAIMGIFVVLHGKNNLK